MKKPLTAAVVTVVAMSSASQAMARDYIAVVGSSTVFPFATTVAENFGRSTSFKTPKIESTGSGGGMRLFCVGVGVDHPDITNASRRMKPSEFDKCRAAGVKDIVEVKIGALSMEGGCKTFGFIAAMKRTDEKKYKGVCHGVREDRVYIEAGENDHLIVQKPQANPNALGIFGFSFLDQNANKIQGSKINGVESPFESISSEDYPVSRSLYFYVKKAHVGTIPGVEEYVAEFTNEGAWGPDGYLANKGLIPLPDDVRSAMAKSAQSLQPMGKPESH